MLYLSSYPQRGILSCHLSSSIVTTRIISHVSQSPSLGTPVGGRVRIRVRIAEPLSSVSLQQFSDSLEARTDMKLTSTPTLQPLDQWIYSIVSSTQC